MSRAKRASLPRQSATSLWVVIPAYDEEAWIEKTLDSLAVQSDRDFRLVVVDNGSRDATSGTVERWLRDHRGIHGELIFDPMKGTNAACDTGFRHAIDRGADWIARTDADCLPAIDWISSIRSRSATTRMITGRIVARSDDFHIGIVRRAFLRAVVTLARVFGKVRPSNRDPRYLRSYVPCSGGNMAIESGLYLETGGFSRTGSETVHGDRELANKARLLTREIAYCREIVVAHSTRRLQRYGLLRTLFWYWDHRYVPEEVDIR